MKKQLVSICAYEGKLVGMDAEGNLWEWNNVTRTWTPFKG